jgi:hypothetical protein
MAPPQLVEDRYRPDAGGGLQQRDHFALEDVDQRIGAPSLAPGLLVGRQSWIVLEAVGRGHADTCLGSRYR